MEKIWPALEHVDSSSGALGSAVNKTLDALIPILVNAPADGELLDLLELPRYPSWHYRRYGVEALLVLGRKAEAVQYAEDSRGLNQPDSVIDQCPRISNSRPSLVE